MTAFFEYTQSNKNTEICGFGEQEQFNVDIRS